MKVTFNRSQWLKKAELTPYQQGYKDRGTLTTPRNPDNSEYMKGWKAQVAYDFDQHEKEHGKLSLVQVKDK